MAGNELQELFAQGDAELHGTAGEAAVLCRRMGGQREDVSVVISPAEVAYTLQRATGPVLTCERVAHIQRKDAARAPQVGDTLDVAGDVYEVVRVTGWAFDTSWHCDLAQRLKPKTVKRA